MDAALQSANNCEFVRRAVRAGVRLDGRGVDDVRPLVVEFGKDWGQCQVTWGKTRVLAVVSAEVVAPYPDRPTEGMLTFAVELSPMASTEFEQHRSSEFSVEVTRALERCLKESRAVDREALCIAAHKKVWSVRCDVHVLDHSGNLLDAANVCALLALLHFRRRDSLCRGEETIIFSEAEREPVPLSVHYIPISISFALFDNGELAVVDPSEEEELVMDGRITITVNSFQDVCALQKNGGVPIDTDLLMRCVQQASLHAERIIAKIREQLDNDVNKRLAGRLCISQPPPKQRPTK